MSQATEHEGVKEILDTRIFLTKQSISNIDECFRLLGKQPVPSAVRVDEVVLEEYRSGITEIQKPQLKALYTLHKARELMQVHIGAYKGLIAMAEFMGDIPISALLETNLAAKMVFIERTRELMLEIGRGVVTARMMRKAA